MKNPILYLKNLKKGVFAMVLMGFISSGLFLEIITPRKGEAESLLSETPVLELTTIQENSLLALSTPARPPQIVQKLNMVITAYSSTVWQTDETPFITASGSEVKNGVVANNFLPFGTKIRIPQLYGDKIFVVEDRMHWNKSNYHLDIWFPDYSEAKNFGAKQTYVEIIN